MNRRQLAAVIYAGGHPMHEVALVMSLTYNTVVTHIKRTRREYRRRGIAAGTVVELGRALRADGLLRD